MLREHSKAVQIGKFVRIWLWDIWGPGALADLTERDPRLLGRSHTNNPPALYLTAPLFHI